MLEIASFPTVRWKATLSFLEKHETLRSPLFKFQYCEWYLKWEDCHLYLKQKSQGRYRPFPITCFIQNDRESIGSTTTICYPQFKKTEKQIWSSSGFSSELDIFRMGHPEFVVIFHGEYSFTLQATEETKTDTKFVKNLSDSSVDNLSVDFGNLLESGDACDVQLKCGDTFRMAHRPILAARSAVFAAMFRSNMKENTSGIVDICDMDADVLDLFLKYAYTGKLPEPAADDVLDDLYAAGDKYAMHSLKKWCCNRVKEIASHDNYNTFLIMADMYNDEVLKNIVIESIIGNPQWLNSDKWLDFSKQQAHLANEVYRRFCDKEYFKKA